MTRCGRGRSEVVRRRRDRRRRGRRRCSDSCTTGCDRSSAVLGDAEVDALVVERRCRDRELHGRRARCARSIRLRWSRPSRTRRLLDHAVRTHGSVRRPTDHRVHRPGRSGWTARARLTSRTSRSRRADARANGSSGTFASVAVAAAAWRGQRTGHGEHIDLAMSEVMTIASSGYREFTHVLRGGGPIAGPIRNIETPSIEPTLDGYVGFCTNSREQLNSFLMLIERFDLLAEEAFGSARGTASAVGRVERDRPRVDAVAHHRRVVKQASELRIPVAPVYGPDNILECDHFVARDVFVEDPTGTFRAPRRPWRMDDEDPPPPTSSPRFGEHTGTRRGPRTTRPAAPPSSPRAAAGRTARPRPHGLVGRSDRREHARHAGRRRDPRRVDQSDRRHARHRCADRNRRRRGGNAVRTTSCRTRTSADSRWTSGRPTASPCCAS